MREAGSMRDRVEAGEGMLFVSLLALGASWFWFQNTSSPSLWWGISGVLVLASLVGIARGVQLILSGFSGFGRNFCEEREPLDPGPNDEAYDHDAAVSKEVTKVSVVPGLLIATGVVAVVFRVLPSLNVPDGFPDMNFVPTRILVPWMYFVGAATICWSIMVVVMMRTGQDRWAFVPGTRAKIASSMTRFAILGVVMIAIAAAFTLIV